MKEALKKLAETRAAANAEVFPDPRTRAGWEMKKNQARAALDGVKADFDRTFKKAGFPVFLTGPNAEVFTKLAAEEAEIVTVGELLPQLRATVKANIGISREFGVAAFTGLLRELRQLGANLGLTTIDTPNFQSSEYVKDDDATDAVIDRYLKLSVGPQFIAALIEAEAANKAEVLSGEQPVVPVFITGITTTTAEAVGPKLFTGKFLIVDTNQEVSPEFVLDTFKSIKQTLKQ